MIVQMEKAPNTTSKERAQQLYNKNIELEKKRQKSLQAKLPSDPNIWYQIRENYEAIILEDYAFSEKLNIEFHLWQHHYKRIEEFRGLYNASQSSGRASVQPDRISKIRGQFKAFLSEATGFYHGLIVKSKAKYGLSLGHVTEELVNEAGPDTGKSSDAKKALVSCHRCLIYLGDLARYKGLYGEGESRHREFSAASSYYLQAVSLWPSNGNPHHQLAILSTYSNDELVAVYRYFRSLAIEVPFATAKENLLTAFEKNRQSYTQSIEAKKTTSTREVSIKEKYKEFCTQFIRLNGILFTRTSVETFTAGLSSLKETFQEILSSGQDELPNFGRDNTDNGLFILRLAGILIFTVYNASKKNEGQSYSEILQHNVLCENARSLIFEVMSLVIERCVQLLDPSSSFLLPGILVVLEWLSSCLDFTTSTTNENKQSACESLFWKNCIALFNKLLSSRLVDVDDDGGESFFTNMSRYVEGETESQLALPEDFELRGFVPLLSSQNNLDFSRKQSNREKQIRVKRFIAAGKALANVVKVDHKSVLFDSKAKKFVIGVQPSSFVGPVESHSIEQEDVAVSSVNPMPIRDNVLLFEGDDEDEEIVFKPAFVEKEIDSIHGSIPLSVKNVPPVKDLPNSAWLLEQQTSLENHLSNLGFLENNHELKYESKGSSGFPDGGSNVPPQPSVSLMDPAIMYSDYGSVPEAMIPSKVDLFPSVSSKSQMGRPVRHLGPPPGFNMVPPKHDSMPVSSTAGTNGSLVLDDYRWLDGYHMPSSSSTIRPNNASNNSVYVGNSQFVGNMNSSNGNPRLPFPGMQGSAVQFQGGNLKNYPEYQSFQNMNSNHGHKMLEQQVMAGNHQFTSQAEHYQGQFAWNYGPYRV